MMDDRRPSLRRVDQESLLKVRRDSKTRRPSLAEVIPDWPALHKVKKPEKVTLRHRTIELHGMLNCGGWMRLLRFRLAKGKRHVHDDGQLTKNICSTSIFACIRSKRRSLSLCKTSNVRKKMDK